MKSGIAVGLFLMICISPQVSAEIYKWTNADGELVYSQTPPPVGVTATVVDTMISSEATHNKDSSAETIPDEAAEVTEKCKIALTNIESLGQATPETVFKTADNGQRTYTQDELNANIIISQDFMNAWCDQ